MIRVGIVGASGYTGQECVRLLSAHPQVTIAHVFANRLANSSTADYFNNKPDIPCTFEQFNPTQSYDIECLILAVPHTQAHPIMSAICVHSYKVIDLSADFRLNSSETYNATYNQEHSCKNLISKFVYGVPEIHFHAIKQASYIANPGCFAIASILALFPLTSNEGVANVIIDAKTGVSGAGKTLDESLLYCEVNEQVRAYKTNKHRHGVEIKQECGLNVLFSPHLVPMQRGILASCYVTCNKHISKSDIVNLYKNSYKNQPFISIKENNIMPSTKAVVRSNMCELSITQVENNQFVIFSAIDNLIKGSAGNAIQCLNIMFNLDQEMGIPKIAERI
jgi:N-acetyl-gamma-glutamyl-phosphate reductase